MNFKPLAQAVLYLKSRTTPLSAVGYELMQNESRVREERITCRAALALCNFDHNSRSNCLLEW